MWEAASFCSDRGSEFYREVFFSVWVLMRTGIETRLSDLLATILMVPEQVGQEGLSLGSVMRSPIILFFSVADFWTSSRASKVL